MPKDNVMPLQPSKSIVENRSNHCSHIKRLEIRLNACVAELSSLPRCAASGGAHHLICPFSRILRRFSRHQDSSSLHLITSPRCRIRGNSPPLLSHVNVCTPRSTLSLPSRVNIESSDVKSHAQTQRSFMAFFHYDQNSQRA